MSAPALNMPLGQHPETHRDPDIDNSTPVDRVLDGESNYMAMIEYLSLCDHKEQVYEMFCEWANSAIEQKNKGMNNGATAALDELNEWFSYHSEDLI